MKVLCSLHSADCPLRFSSLRLVLEEQDVAGVCLLDEELLADSLVLPEVLLADDVLPVDLGLQRLGELDVLL